ncbi:MAG: sodium:solute symporter family protein [Acidobacteria bacterium]|nr:sodium:solute symporter family protein [Acidobacteriota bacterium]
MLILLLVYSVALVALGAWVGRAVRKTDDFFVGGRSLGAGLLFSTFMAANIGAGSTVNVAGLAYHNGLSAWWWNGSAGIGTLILAFWIGPKIWREASARGYLTVGDFLNDKFGPEVRGFSTIVIWIGSLSIYAGQMIGAAAVLEVVGGVSRPVGAMIAAVVMTAYSVAGGLLSAAWVNRVQLIVILTGFAFAAPIALSQAGGVAHAIAAVPDTTFFQGSSVSTGWAMLFLMGPAFFLSPGLVQRAFAAKNERVLRTGVAWSGVALMIFAWAPVALGVAAASMFPDILSPDQVLPTVLTQGVPWFVGGIALAAVFSAEISSADAVLFMLSTSGARDLYRGYLKPTATDAEVLKMARAIAVAAGILGFGLVFVHETVIDALKTFYEVLGVTLLAPILGGLYLPRGGRPAAMSAMLVGLAALFSVKWGLPAGALGWVSPSLAGLILSATTYVIVTVTRRQS